MKTFIQLLKEKEENKEELLDFFMQNSEPKDSAVHDLADKLNMKPDDLEHEVYSILTAFTAGGFAKEKGFTEKDADPKELKMGIEVEYEHLNKKSKYATALAKRIAIDHLAEMPDYYTKLAVMEGEH